MLRNPGRGLALVGVGKVLLKVLGFYKYIKGFTIARFFFKKSDWRIERRSLTHMWGVTRSHGGRERQNTAVLLTL